MTIAYNGGNFAVSTTWVILPVSKNSFACSIYARLSEYPRGMGIRNVRKSLITKRLQNKINKTFFTLRWVCILFLNLME